MKFYTDPDYFLELWCLEIAKDTENQMKKHKQRGRRTAVSMLVALAGQNNYCTNKLIILSALFLGLELPLNTSAEYLGLSLASQARVSP